MDKSIRNQGEFDLIDRFADILNRGANLPPEIVVGIGDDCAVARRGDDLDVYTTDTLVDGVHFRRGQIPWFDLGWKSIAVSLSDVAAMGARPLHCLVTLAVPNHVTGDELAELYSGISAITGQYGGVVVGGDIVRASELSITVSAVGTISGGGRPQGTDGVPAMLRSAARPGDVLAITGDIGSAAGGLKALEDAENGADDLPEALIERHFRPTPRIAAGVALAAAGVRCAIDISDGLVADLGHICDASGVSAEIQLADVPVSPVLKEAYPEEWTRLALSGGEDYELLFTAPPEIMDAVRSAIDVPVTVIGEIRTGTSGVTVFDDKGQPLVVDSGGWDHLRQ